MFSAVHIDGRRAYELARSGKNVDMKPRTVEVYSLELTEIAGDSWHFRMRCAPGTYVRSIARDIAHELGTVATVDMIRRTRTSGFTIKNAHTLDFLENLFNNGDDVGGYLAPMDFGLGDIPVLNLDDNATKLYRNGGFIKVGLADGTYRVYFGKDLCGCAPKAVPYGEGGILQACAAGGRGTCIKIGIVLP